MLGDEIIAENISTGGRHGGHGDLRRQTYKVRDTEYMRMAFTVRGTRTMGTVQCEVKKNQATGNKNN